VTPFHAMPLSSHCHAATTPAVRWQRLPPPSFVPASEPWSSSGGYDRHGLVALRYPPKTARCFPVAKSQSRSARSYPPVASQLPSGAGSRSDVISLPERAARDTPQDEAETAPGPEHDEDSRRHELARQQARLRAELCGLVSRPLWGRSPLGHEPPSRLPGGSDCYRRRPIDCFAAGPPGRCEGFHPMPDHPIGAPRIGPRYQHQFSTRFGNEENNRRR
jgi:hypothetical protein